MIFRLSVIFSFLLTLPMYGTIVLVPVAEAIKVTAPVIIQRVVYPTLAAFGMRALDERMNGSRIKYERDLLESQNQEQQAFVVGFDQDVADFVDQDAECAAAQNHVYEPCMFDMYGFMPPQRAQVPTVKKVQAQPCMPLDQDPHDNNDRSIDAFKKFLQDKLKSHEIHALLEKISAGRQQRNDAAHQKLTNKEARLIANFFGAVEVKDPPMDVHGQILFWLKKERFYFSADVDRHKGGTFKVFDNQYNLKYATNWNFTEIFKRY